MKIIKVKENGTVIIVESVGNRTPERFLKSRPNQGFRLVDLPKSKYNFYKEVDGEIVEDTERTLQKEGEDFKAMLTNKIKEHIDKQAVLLGFDNLYNAGVYQTQADNPLKPNAEKLGAWAGNVWGKAMELQAQKVDITSWEELKALLPKF